MPSPLRRSFAKKYFATMVTELSSLARAEAVWVEMCNCTFPALRLDSEVILVGELPASFEEQLFQQVLNDLNLPSSHARVAIDYVLRYRHPHMAVAFDRIEGPIRGRRLFHPQHRNLLQECESISDNKKQLLEALFYPNPNWVVADVGCYLGYGSLWMSGLVTEGKVISVEAVARNHEIATANQAQNRVANWDVLRGAIWDVEDISLPITIGSRQANAIDSSVITGLSSENVGTISVASLTAQAGVAFDLLSMSVNGAEVEAVKGMGCMHPSMLPKRVLAPGWYLVDSVPRATLIVPMLVRMGYEVFCTPGNFIFAWLPDVVISK